MKQDYRFLDAQKLLIKPFDRLQFVFLYVFASFLGTQFAEIGMQQPWFANNNDDYQLLYTLFGGLALGGFLGLFQWLVIRKYIPEPQWILATVTYYCLVAIARVFWVGKFETLDSQPFRDVGQMILLSLSSLSWWILNAFIYGYAQHYVVSPYIRKFRWWLWVTSISFVFQMIGFPLTIVIVVHLLRLRIRDQTFFLMTFALIQAIAFCFLYRKSSLNDNEDPTLDPVNPSFNLAIAPDLTNFWQIRSIQKKFDRKLSKIWRTDLEGNEDLTYWVGVDRQGQLVACVPRSQAAVDRLSETPLISLGNSSADGLNQPIAKFNVTFSPPCLMRMESCRGIPRRWLALGMAIGILGISLLLPQFGLS
jgi:hypothetical protein